MARPTRVLIALLTVSVFVLGSREEAKKQGQEDSGTGVNSRPTIQRPGEGSRVDDQSAKKTDPASGKIDVVKGAERQGRGGTDPEVNSGATRQQPRKEIPAEDQANKKTDSIPKKKVEETAKKTEGDSAKEGQEVEKEDEEEDIEETWPPNGITLEDDPALWPGHLKPIGSKAPVKRIDARKGFPSPKVFLEEYAISSVPVLFKGAVKDSAAFKKWTSDDYLRSFPQSATKFHLVESKKKESRTQPHTEMTMRQFLDRYDEEDIYLVDVVPEFLMRDVPMPKPLLCKSFIEMLQDTVMWFSSGGTRSVLHYDDMDNINCLFDGQKELTFISYRKYKNKVPIDHPDSRYSSMDIDAVDFTQFPGMREVEYYRVNMTAGDCLYVPYMWFHQVNSYGRNIAVNIWWDHDAKTYVKMLSQTCADPPDSLTLDDFDFKMQQTEQGDNKDQDPLTHFVSYLPVEKDANLTFRQFEAKIKKDELTSKLVNWTDESTQLAREMFDQLNVNQNLVFSHDDLDLLTPELEKEIIAVLEDRILDFNDIANDQEAEIKEDLAMDVTKKQMESYSAQIKKMIDDQIAAMTGKAKPSVGSADTSDSYSTKEDIKDKFREKQKQREEERMRADSDEDEFSDFAEVEEEEEEEEVFAEDDDDDDEVVLEPMVSKKTKDNAPKSKVSMETGDNAPISTPTKASKETKHDASKSVDSTKPKADEAKSKVSMETKDDAPTSKVSMETKDDAPKSTPTKPSKETKDDASTSQVSKETKDDAPKSTSTKSSKETKDGASKPGVSMKNKDEASKSKVSMETKDDALKSKGSMETGDNAPKSTLTKASKDTNDDASKSEVSKKTKGDASKSKVSMETKDNAPKSTPPKASKDTKDDATKPQVSKSTTDDASKPQVSKKTKDESSKSKETKDAASASISKKTKEEAPKSKVSKEIKDGASKSATAKTAQETSEKKSKETDLHQEF